MLKFTDNNLEKQLERCYARRSALINGEHQTAYRLFNGFYEGMPGFTVDIFGSSLVISDHNEIPGQFDPVVQSIQQYTLSKFPWLKAVLVKSRHAPAEQAQRGIQTHGEKLDDHIIENNVKYAIDLRLNQDSSFYLDTRNLRTWIRQNLEQKTVLNTFSYSGSLGIAACAAGAQRVIQTDINSSFFNLARKSYQLNKLHFRPSDLLEMDFFRMVDRFKTSQTLFDCVILDPPFFSISETGKIDLVNEYARLVNKVRPLVAHNGWLIAINNALFLKGSDLVAQIEDLCRSGYLKIEKFIAVPDDITGYPDTILNAPPVDPAPFNHPTKMMILRVTRKDQKSTTIHA